MKNKLVVIALLLFFCGYSQNDTERFFAYMLKNAEIEYQDFKGFDVIDVGETKSFCSHPRLDCFVIMHKTVNNEKDICAVYEVLPKRIDGKEVCNDCNMFVPLYEADIDLGRVYYIDKNVLRDKYNATEGVFFYLKMRKSLESKYSLCKKVYIQKEGVGRISILLFYNKEYEEYISDLINQMYFYIRFKK